MRKGFGEMQLMHGFNDDTEELARAIVAYADAHALRECPRTTCVATSSGPTGRMDFSSLTFSSWY